MKNYPSQSLPYISIKPNSVTYYYQSMRDSPRYEKTHFEIKQPKNNDPKRGLSKKARKRITNKINWLLTFAKPKRVFNERTDSFYTFKINFITLTLPSLQFHTDKTIKNEALDPFLTKLRKFFNLKNYVWRAECQANGSIHFHIATDSYIPWFIIRSTWNHYLRKLGYIEKFNSKFSGMDFETYKAHSVANGIKDLSTILGRWKKGNKTNWKDPNTTDIHSVAKVDNLAAYLSKYMAKDEQEKDSEGNYNLKYRKLKGRQWGCSQSLSRCKSIIELVDTKFSDLGDYITAQTDHFLLKEDYFTFISSDFSKFAKGWRSFINNIFLAYKKLLDYHSGGLPPKRFVYS